MATYPSQLISPQQFWISEFSQYQAGMESTTNQSATPHQFEPFDNHQHLDEVIKSHQNPVLLQFTQEEDFTRQYNSFRDVNVSNDFSATRFQEEPPTLAQNGGFQEDCHSHPSHWNMVPISSQTSDEDEIAQPRPTKLQLFNGFPTLQVALQAVARERQDGYPEAENEDRDSEKKSSEEFEVPTVDLNIFPEQEGGSDLNARNFELDDNGKDQDFDYEIPRDNIGHLESNFSADSSGGGYRAFLSNELGVSSDTNLATGEVNAVHFANSLLSSIMENLEEDGEEGSSTYKHVFNSCHIPTIEDPLAMIGDSRATAGTPEVFQKEAVHATGGVFHGGMYYRGDYSANKKQKLMPGAEAVDSPERQNNQLLPTGGYGLATSDNLLPNNGAEGSSSVTHNKYSRPAGGYGTPASNNPPQNDGADRDVFGGLHKDYSLAGEYGLAVDDGRPPNYGATRAADTNFNSDIFRQRYFSPEQRRAPITMESCPVNWNRELNNEVLPSSFDNAQFGRPGAPVVQSLIQMPRSGHNPESDSILPSIEFDIVDGNNTAEQQNELPKNQAKENPIHWDMSHKTNAPSPYFQYARSLGEGIEAEFKKAWTNEEIEEDPNSPVLFFDSVSEAQETFAYRFAMNCNEKLETEGEAAMEGQVIDDETLLRMPSPPCRRPFYFENIRKPLPYDRRRRNSLTSIRSPKKEWSPPDETGPEVPKYEFSTGEVPILPPDFNTVQEIKRRLIAKDAISSKKHNKRCSLCGYMGHVSSWAGCPTLICRLCNQEGHGSGFCPKAQISNRWRDRQGKKAAERLRVIQMEREEKKKVGKGLGRPEVGRGLKASRNQNTSLLMKKRQRLTNENQAWIDEGKMRAPVSNMTTWPTVSTISNAQTTAPMNRAQINAKGMRAPIPNMTTWPMVSTLENAQTIAPVNQAQINAKEMSGHFASMIAGPKVSAFENTQTFAPTNHAQINEEVTRTSIALMVAWPMVNSSESDRNIASTTKDNWSHARLNTAERQPWVDMNMGMLRTPDTQMMATGPTVNLNSFENSLNIASKASDNWPYAEWQPFEDTRMNTHGQETVVPSNTMTNQQGYSSIGSEAGQEQYLEYRLDGQGRFLFKPGVANAKSTTETEIQDTEGNDTGATMDQQEYKVTKLGNDLLGPKAHAHTATEYNQLPKI